MTAVLELGSQLAGVAAFVTAVVTAIVMWRKSGPETRRTGAEAGKTDAEGQAVLSGAALSWTERADARAEKFEAKALAAEEDARVARAQSEQCARDRANDRELLADLRRDHDALQLSYDRLLEQIARCNAGTFCPVADGLTR